MSPLNAAICTTISYIMSWMILFKKQLFDLEVQGQGLTKVITVRDTLPYDHAPTYQISLTYLERQKRYVPDKKILFKKTLFDLEVKGQGPTKVIMVRDTPHPHTKYNWPIWKDEKVMVRTSFAEKKQKKRRQKKRKQKKRKKKSD